MANIQHIVWRYIDNNPAVKRMLNQNLLNKRALANLIFKELKIEPNIDAAITAIRRYNLKETDINTHKAKEIIAKAIDISTRTNMAIMTMKKNAMVQTKISKLYSDIKYDEGDTIRIIHADTTVKIITNQENLQNILSLFPKNVILLIQKNIAEINIRLKFNIDADITPGSLAVIIDEIAINEISIVEILSCFPEVILFFYEKDISNAYMILSNLIYSIQQDQRNK